MDNDQAADWTNGVDVDFEGEVEVFPGIHVRVKGGLPEDECIDYAVGGRHGRLGEMTVEESNCIREKKMIGDSINHMESSVVLECRSNVETLTVAEVP